MQVQFSKDQIKAALTWIAECANPNWNEGCIIKNPTMMQHPEFPEYLFLNYTAIKNTEDSGLHRSTNYTVISKDGTKQSMSDLWDKRDTRMGIIADLMAFRLENGKIVFE